MANGLKVRCPRDAGESGSRCDSGTCPTL